MAVSVDLSSERLSTNAVVALLKAHVKAPPKEDLLFKVSQRAFKAFCIRPKDAVRVSKKELAQLNKALRGSFTAGDFTKWRHQKCAACGKLLTFFDFFQSGRKRHGDGYITDLFGTADHYVHLQPRGRRIAVECTQCGKKNLVLSDGYDGPNY